MTRSTSDISNIDRTFDGDVNYVTTRQQVGYVPRSEADSDVYARLGFKCGLEIHQQLLTEKKLFCHCPAGIYQKGNDFDAEVIRHMRPTLSEMGEYDGTALMEKRTRKVITYRLKNETACTYEVDDTPPFKINREALGIAIEISLLLGTNVVGELHITRKQYLDGSIPTGFQRTAIVGIEGEISLRKKKVRIIQLSIEEDSCREVADVGHDRIYTTDRLGMPLIEMVTYPDMLTPDESAEAGQMLRLGCRTTGHVRTGIGAGRQDVNVSITGGTRIEIKGVSHISWIPELTHNEAFRQKSLLVIADELRKRVGNPSEWKLNWKDVSLDDFEHGLPFAAGTGKQRLTAVNLPEFKGMLSHFTQPGQTFVDELSGRLKVIACLERPNVIHSEQTAQPLTAIDLGKLRELLEAGDSDAQLLIWGEDRDIDTALEILQERCEMAFEGVPNETRKSLRDGTTLFERVLPGPDRMYPDTDSAPLSISDELIEEKRKGLPAPLTELLEKLRGWNIPEDTYYYLLTRSLLPLIEQTIDHTDWPASFVGTLFGHTYKGIRRRHARQADFSHDRVVDLCKFVHDQGLDKGLVKRLLPGVYENPQASFESLLGDLDLELKSREELCPEIPELSRRFDEVKKNDNNGARMRWIMGQLRKFAPGKVSLKELVECVEKEACHE